MKELKKQPKTKDNTFLYFGKEFDTSDWPNWAEYIAIDKVGMVYVYDRKPYVLECSWSFYNNINTHIGIFTFEEMRSINWEETLVEL